MAAIARDPQEERKSRAEYADDEDNPDYKKLRPAGRRIAKILDAAMKAQEHPEDPYEGEEPYYWEMEKGADPDAVGAPRKVAQNVHWVGRQTFHGLEFVGEIAANFLGLTKSRYQWIIDQAERDEEMKKIKELEDKQRMRLAIERQIKEETRRAKELEAELGEAAEA